jgi:hypothetical protein
MDGDLKQKVLKRACEIAGGAERLSERLDVDRHSLEFWLSGRATAPEYVFLTVVDIVLDDDIARAAQDRRRNVIQRQVFGTFPLPRETTAPAGANELPAGPS